MREEFSGVGGDRKTCDNCKFAGQSPVVMPCMNCYGHNKWEYTPIELGGINLKLISDKIGQGVELSKKEFEYVVEGTKPQILKIWKENYDNKKIL